jgi:hypothetical protein
LGRPATNSFPKDNKAPTIDAPATDAEEAKGDAVVVVWGGGSKVR